MSPAARRATPVPAEVREASAAVRDGRVEDAIALLGQALARDPGSAAAHSTRGMALLSLGRFEEGFAEYEWRHRVRGFEGDRPSAPRWDGSAVDGRTLLLWDEQGLGDTIQFARFVAPAAAASKAQLLFGVAPRLCRLLRAGARGWEVRSRERGLPVVDVKIPSPTDGQQANFRREFRLALVRGGLEKMIRPLKRM